MSHRATSPRLLTAASLTGLAAFFLQSATAQTLKPDWRALGRPAIEMHLVSPAGGPVDSVWFSGEGRRLFARTSFGETFQTVDGEHWDRTDAIRSVAPQAATARRLPEAGARIVSTAADARRIWALGHSLSVSEDGGASWTNLTGVLGDSVIGADPKDLAVNPSDAEDVVVASDQGVWRSHDGGQSWSGLNENLPALPVSRILSVQRAAWRVTLQDGHVEELNDARASWQPAGADSALGAEGLDRAMARGALHADITASAKAGDRMIVGSGDGRVWSSSDKGMTWPAMQQLGRSAVLRIAISGDNARSVIATLAGPGPRVFRSVNGGETWDDITANLPEGQVRAAAMDRLSNTVYLATDKGVFSGQVDLNAFAPVAGWSLLSSQLPQEPVMDVALDPATGQLFAALRGFGLYTAVVNGSSAVRILNAADFSTRPAAPGSVISVAGAKVTSARADNLSFPVLAAGENASQIQVPFEAPAAVLSLSMEAATGRVTLPLPVRTVSPAVFVDRDGAPFLVDADSGVVLDGASGAHPGMRLQIMATGLGRVQPDWPTGVAAPDKNIPRVAAAMKVYLDGLPLEVKQATLAPGYVGYYVVEFELPAIVNSGMADLYVTADGQPSNHVSLLLNAQ